MRTQLRRALLGAMILSLAAAGPVSAHGHQICTPGRGDPIIDPEPFHGQDPTNGAILSNPNVTAAAYAAWGLHPIHHFLHIGPSVDARAISVVRTDRASCP